VKGRGSSLSDIFSFRLKVLVSLLGNVFYKEKKEVLFRMKVILRQRNYRSSDLIDRYQSFLELSRSLVGSLSINVEKILYGKVVALPKSVGTLPKSSFTPEVITLSLDKDFSIKGCNESTDGLSKRDSFSKVEFIGSVKGIRAVFTVTVRGIGRDRNDYGDIEIYAYNNDFDGFDELFKRVKLDLKPVLSIGVIEYFVIGSLDSRVYDLDKIIVFSANDVRAFVSVMVRFLRRVLHYRGALEELKLLALNDRVEFVRLVSESFTEKGYNVILSDGLKSAEQVRPDVLFPSITIYGDKPLLDGYLNLLKRFS